MKAIIFSLLILFSSIISAHSQSYRSKWGNCVNQTAVITLSTAGGVITATRTVVTYVAGDKVTFYNATASPYHTGTGGGVYINTPGTNYWIIPFNGGPPFQVTSNPVTIDCSCGGQGTCAITDAGPAGKTCDPSPTCSQCCDMVVYGGVAFHNLGGILVQASKVILQ